MRPAEYMEADSLEFGADQPPMQWQPMEIPGPRDEFLIGNLDRGNLVELIDELEKKTHSAVYEDIMTSFGDAEATMEKWKKRYNKALKLAKMQPTDSSGTDIDSKSFPFDGASVAMMPFILEAMLDFSSRASPDLVWTDSIVTAKVNGADEDDAKQARADRVEEYMNYQITNIIPGWRKGQDKAVMALPCVGTCYKKTYYDYEEKRVCSDFLMADKVIFNMECENFEDAPDKFERITYSRNDTIGFIRGEQSWMIAEEDLDQEQDTDEFIIAHTWIDLDEDGLKEPYCAVLHEESNKIVCLYPDYDEDTISYNKDGDVVKIRDNRIYTQYIFLPDPEGGPMGMGWGILLGPTFTAINTLVRQNIDAGTLNLTSSNSGLIAQNIGEGRGNRQLSAQVNVAMGQLTPYPMGGIQGSLRDNVVQFPFAGPSPVLFQLTEYLAGAARQLSTAAYSVEANAGEAAELYLARLQQGLKVPNSIVMRVYECAKEEFQKIALLNYKHHDSDYYNKVLDEQQKFNMKADFDPKDCDVDLVADPSQGSDIERIAKANNVYRMAMEQAAAGQPVIQLRQATIDLLEAQKVPNVEQLAPEPDPNAPPPPEMQAILAQQQFEAGLKKKELELKEAKQQLEEQKLQLDKLKQAHEAAKSLSELGLKADLDEATITEKYANALKGLVKDAGLTFEEAKREVVRIESDFINDNPQAERGALNAGQTAGQIPANYSGPV